MRFFKFVLITIPILSCNSDQSDHCFKRIYYRDHDVWVHEFELLKFPFIKTKEINNTTVEIEILSRKGDANYIKLLNKDTLEMGHYSEVRHFLRRYIDVIDENGMHTEIQSYYSPFVDTVRFYEKGVLTRVDIFEMKREGLCE